MIHVDGRTDIEKLRELLGSPEETHLEFKSRLDLNDKKASLEFVKDAVSMGNRPPGGYILVGVNDDSKPVMPIGAVTDRSAFDSARLGDLIRKHVEGEIHIVSQFHDLEQNEVILIYVRAGGDGLPIPMAKLGQYDGPNKRTHVVFRPGDILIREGAANVPLRHAHWPELLKERDERLRAESMKHANDLMALLAKTLRSANSVGEILIPLSVEMSDEAFAESVTTHLDKKRNGPIRQFLAKASAVAANPDHQERALDKITVAAALALFSDDTEIFSLAVDALFDTYSKYSRNNPKLGLEIINRVYVLGSFVVRRHKWELIPAITVRRYAPHGDEWAFASWIRHGQVEASDKRLFPSGEEGMMISMARDLLLMNEHLRPDIPNEALPADKTVKEQDLLLDSLCQFDILYCLTVTAEGKGTVGAYPASTAFNQHRTNPAFDLVTRNADIRRKLFPTSDDKEIAEAVKVVFELAQQQSTYYSNRWWSITEPTKRFLETHAQ